MAEFDELSFHPDDGSDAFAFMSTPTKWTRSSDTPFAAPSNMTRRSIAVPTTITTTTPSAILPSPYERELRREYAPAGGRSRVAFADIREESVED